MNNEVKKLIELIVGLAALLLAAYVPELSEDFDILAPAIVALFVAVFAGVPLVDAIGEFVHARATRDVVYKRLDELREQAKLTPTQIDDIVSAMLDAVAGTVYDEDEPETEAPPDTDSA